MLDFKCSICGESFHSSTELEYNEHKTCPECGGALVPAGDADRMMTVHIGAAAYEVREADVAEQVRRLYRESGFNLSLVFYQHLRPDLNHEEVKETVLTWLGSFKKGSVLYVSEST